MLLYLHDSVAEDAVLSSFVVSSHHLILLLQLYRDCLRLIHHVAPGRTSAKAVALRQTVKNEFSKHRQETNPEQIEAAKANAIRALSNYLLAMNAPKDPKMTAAMKDYHGRSVQQAKQTEHDGKRP
jgi:hypothetical protein